MKAVDEALVQVVVIDEVVLDDEAFELDDLMSLPEKDKDVYPSIGFCFSNERLFEIWCKLVRFSEV